ncbi:MMS19 nucleotide excision repair protein isoform X2 [Oratosquilla oratoria]|uniref:MMS19 nucleotide excision repair protein isoform X2 n=1 Tax=Oratosquilla oratoria TaxID=337810 RepID=UPI003F757455
MHAKNLNIPARRVNMSTNAEISRGLSNIPESTGNSEDLILEVVQGFNNGIIQLHEVVEAMQSSLAHKDASIRGQGTWVEMKHISGDDVINLVRGLFREIHCQSQVMSDRRNIYTFLKHCVISRGSDTEKMGADFVFGFISAMDGEKDPRNLMLLFTMVPVIVKIFNLGPFTEEMFEVVAAYFPIDFMPPPGDPYGIAAEDLVLGLRNCLASSPNFAPFCIPLLEEKLNSDLKSAKLDALYTLAACCKVYSAEDIRPHALVLLGDISREVMEGWSSQLEEAGLEALTAMVSALLREPSSFQIQDIVNQLTNTVLMDCTCHLAAPEQRLMYPSWRLLCAVVVAHEMPAAIIVDKVLPLLASQFMTKTGDTARKNTIDILARLMNKASRFPGLSEGEGSLASHQEVCWKAFQTGLETVSIPVQEATVSALTIALPALREDLCLEVTNVLMDQLLTTDRNSLRDSITKFLVALCSENQSAVNDCVVPRFLTLLQNNDSKVSKKQIFETLAFLPCGVAVLSKVVGALWTYAENTLIISEPDCVGSLQCISKIVECSVNDQECLQFLVEEWQGVRKILTLGITAVLAQQSTSTPVLHHLAAICRNLIGKLCDPIVTVQPLVFLLLGKSIEEEPVETLLQKFPQLPSFAKQMTSHPQDNTKASFLVHLLEGLTISLPQHVQLEGQRQLLELLWYLSVRATTPSIQFCAAVLQATLINKMKPDESFAEVLYNAQTCFGNILDNIENGDTRKSALTSWVWLTKALVMKGHPDAFIWVEKIKSLFPDPDLGIQAAKSFEVILKDHEYALTPQTKAIVRLLYRQHFFESVLSGILVVFHQSSGISKHNTLLAVSSMLTHVPHQVLNVHITSLFPVLLSGLSSSEDFVVEGTLKTLSSVLTFPAHHASPHVSSLIPTLLSLATNHSLVTRLTSLECLCGLASLDTKILLPYREEVVRSLKVTLNDKKRLVREVSRKARCNWILVGAPGGL